MAQVSWSLSAGQDLQDIEDFIARDSVLHAINFVDRVVESVGALLKTPHIGRMVPEFNRPDLRGLIFRGYRIVYLLQEDMVFILRVVHGSRDLLGLVRREPWEIGG
ncbi:MAG: type II toxin-antitoxin system RelE/ParE family toxin [Nitrospira sp.]|nr:type II toxin-antitoxin system RelE/ParE family toxin [Nitrospira sp.]